jgi:hypothetical protein
MKEALEVWTLKEILDAAISYKRNSERKDRLHELVGKLLSSARVQIGSGLLVLDSHSRRRSD